VVVAREVTKLHEEFLRGSASEILERLRQKPVKGEITVLVGAPQDGEKGFPPARSVKEEIQQVMAERGFDERAALKAVARARRISKSEVYRLWQRDKPGVSN
jgi:16S rRNA (cytidine1402-2'-O)-methyltransferase